MVSQHCTVKHDSIAARCISRSRTPWGSTATSSVQHAHFSNSLKAFWSLPGGESVRCCSARSCFISSSTVLATSSSCLFSASAKSPQSPSSRIQPAILDILRAHRTQSGLNPKAQYHSRNAHRKIKTQYTSSLLRLTLCARAPAGSILAKVVLYKLWPRSIMILPHAV